MLTLEHIDDDARFAALAGEWEGLLGASGSDQLFLTWEWLHTWWTHLRGRRRLFLLAAREGGELIGLAPLCLAPPRLERLVPFRSLEFLGAGTAGSDYLDLIVRRGREEDAVEAFSRHLAGRRLMLQLARAPRAGSLAARLGDGLRTRGWSVREGAIETCPYIDLRGHTWESYLATLGSAHRYNVQRRIKNLQRRHALEVREVRAEPDRRPALAVLLRLHDARWQPRGGSDAFTGDALVAFHDEMTRHALARGWLRLFELRLDGRPAAALYGFRYRDAFSFYQAGFDPAFAKDSVGLCMMALAIRAALAEGAAEYDLLHGDEAYKFQWARQTRDLARLEAYPPRLHGLACRRAVDLGRATSRLARRVLPAAVTARLAQSRAPA
jgi:CelD/BcsL family acetyltransferase involved in cellulose biosynthesis